MEESGPQSSPCGIEHTGRSHLFIKLLRDDGLSVTAVSIVLPDRRLSCTLWDIPAGAVRS